MTNQAKREEFKRLFLQRTHRLTSLAQILGVDYQVVTKWRREDFPEDKHWRYDLFKKLYSHGGFTVLELAYLVEISTSTIKRYIQQIEDERITSQQKGTV